MKQGKKLLSLFLAVAIAVSGINFAGALQVDAAEETKTVTKVTVSPGEATVKKGAEQQFTATVEGTNIATPDEGVTWEVTADEGITAGTEIDANGKLTVSSNETAAELTVIATSKLDTSKSDTATVHVTGSGESAKVAAVEVTPKTADVVKGKSEQFKAVVKGEGNVTPDQGVTWTVSASDGVAAGTKVDSTGKLTVAADETATKLIVTATSNVDESKSDSAVVTVKEDPVDEEVESVEVDPKTAAVNKGESKEFKAVVKGKGNVTPDQGVEWTVAAEGQTSLKEGTEIVGGKLTVAQDETATKLIVTATSTANKSKSGTAEVTVTDPSKPSEVTGVTVTPKTADVNKGEKKTFTAEVEGTNLPDTAKGVTWSVEGSTKSTISETGELTVAADETEKTLTVKATSKTNDKVSGTATVNVLDPSEEAVVTSVEVDPKTAELNKGEKKTFTAEVKGTNLATADKAVTWTVEGSTKSKISETGELTVAADETATTLTVKATSKTNDKVSGTATVTIKGQTGTEAKVTGVTVAPKTANVVKGKTQQFTATVAGTGLAAADKAVTWTVAGAKSTATKIDAAGKLTVAANETAGTLTVKATSKKDTKVSGTATVSVKAAPAAAPVKVSKVKINNKSVKIAAGKKVALTVTVTPKNAANKAVKWSIDNKSKKYASVNAKGVVSTKKKGAGKKVKVTATAADGSGKKATITISIMKNSVTKITLKAKTKTVKAGKSVTIKATVKTNGKKANKTLAWSLDKKAVKGKYATISKKGVLKTKKKAKGKTITVTAKATDGTNKKATIKIKVKK